MLKALEYFGRNLILRLFGARSCRTLGELGEPRSILVIRIDPRVGNVIMLTAFLTDLKAMYPSAGITLLGPSKAEVLLGNAPSLSAFWGFDKKRLQGPNGWRKTLERLRSTAFDLVIDASNPTSPSTTQALLSLMSRTSARLGFKHGNNQSPYDLTVAPLDVEAHENAQRLQLLSRLGRLPSVPSLPNLTHLVPSLSSAMDAWLSQEGLSNFVVINIGARLAEKRLKAEDYRSLIHEIAGLNLGLDILLTYGPDEADLAQNSAASTNARFAPRTDLIELATLFYRADCVVTCDTGPMHLSVALGTPTCGIFVTTAPSRYGYQTERHTRLDARQGLTPALTAEVIEWVGKTSRRI